MYKVKRYSTNQENRRKRNAGLVTIGGVGLGASEILNEDNKRKSK